MRTRTVLGQTSSPQRQNEIPVLTFIFINPRTLGSVGFLADESHSKSSEPFDPKSSYCHLAFCVQVLDHFRAATVPNSKASKLRLKLAFVLSAKLRLPIRENPEALPFNESDSHCAHCVFSPTVEFGRARIDQQTISSPSILQWARSVAYCKRVMYVWEEVFCGVRKGTGVCMRGSVSAYTPGERSLGRVYENPDHRGIVLYQPIGALAHLQLGPPMRNKGIPQRQSRRIRISLRCGKARTRIFRF
jgi:hypothetical protein